MELTFTIPTRSEAPTVAGMATRLDPASGELDARPAARNWHW